MNKDLLLKTLYDLIAPIIANLDYEFYHIELVTEEGEEYLRVYIDKPNGITLSDCEKTSKLISAMLDETDPIPFSYYLEVSSPGIYRSLFNDAHIKKAIGENILITLKVKQNNKLELEGILKSFTESEIIINDNKSELVILRDKINNICLWDNNEGGN